MRQDSNTKASVSSPETCPVDANVQPGSSQIGMVTNFDCDCFPMSSAKPEPKETEELSAGRMLITVEMAHARR